MQQTDWGNSDPTRQNTYPQPIVHKFNYLKLYFTIVAAIISAFTLTYIAALVFGFALLSAIGSSSSTKAFQPAQSPSPQMSAGLQRDLQNLAQRKANEVSSQITQSQQKRSQEAQKKAQQSSNANKADIQTCTFWREQYEKEKTDRNKMHVNGACERAYGNLWPKIP